MKQKSLILELQQLASDNTSSISDVCRKALMAACKLKIRDTEKWLKSELEGYEGREIPDYRNAYAEIHLFNPYHGLVPLYFPDSETESIFKNIELRDPIGNIDSLISRNAAVDGFLMYPLNAEQKQFLLRAQVGQFGERGLNLEPVRRISSSQVFRIAETVRNRILEFSLDLESKGILGWGMSFTIDEKESVRGMTNFNIQNFQGILGDVNESTVTQNNAQTIEAGNIDSLHDYLRNALQLSDADLKEMKTAINKDKPKIQDKKFGKNVSAWIGKIIQKSAEGTVSVGVNVASSVLTTALLSYYGSNC